MQQAPTGPHILGFDVIWIATLLSAVATLSVIYAIYAATTVRVPVFCSHSESVNVETVVKLSAAEAKQILREAPGIILADVPEENIYPMAIDATGKDAIYVGRVREDNSVANGLNLWIVADNLRKGAALNAVQIAEILIRDYI